MPVQHRHRIGKVTPVYVLTEYAASGVVGAVLCTADVIIVITLTLKHRVADVGSRNADPCVYVGVYLLERRKVNGVLDRRCVYVGIDVLAGTALADPAPRVLGDDVALYTMRKKPAPRVRPQAGSHTRSFCSFSYFPS